MTASVRVHEIAFGEFPHRDVDDPSVVEPADGDHEVFLRAVALGGQGRYARAAADLQGVVAAAPGESGRSWRAVARCALASHRRQAGGHRRALADDGLAAALALTAEDATTPLGRAAVVDAFTGLAADLLGVGDLVGSGRLLGRADEVVDALPGSSDVPWWLSGRPALRTAWVRAEWHLYSGRGDDALQAARRAHSLAVDCPSARHRLKTDLLVAACRSVVGDRDDARRAATDVVARARELDQAPLEWATWGLLTDLAPTPEDKEAAASRQRDLGHRLERQLVGFRPPPT
jgi:hypothetical protein